MREKQPQLIWIVEMHKLIYCTRGGGNDSTTSYQYIHILPFKKKRKKSSKITFSMLSFFYI